MTKGGEMMVLKRCGAFRREVRRRVAEAAVEGAERGLAGLELARYVDQASPWRPGSWGFVVWRSERRHACAGPRHDVGEVRRWRAPCRAWQGFPMMGLRR